MLRRWDIAVELAELGGGISRREVARHEAHALAEERPEEAEAAYLRAQAADDAVRMWLARDQHPRALALAEQHAPHMVRYTTPALNDHRLQLRCLHQSTSTFSVRRCGPSYPSFSYIWCFEPDV